MIKVYTHKSFITQEKNEPLFPLLDEFVHAVDSPLTKLFTFVDEAPESDVLILPICIDFLLENKKNDVVDLYYSMASKHNKPLWVSASGDLGLTIKKPNVFVFRLADFESERSKNSIIMAPFIEDPIETFYHSDFNFIPKAEDPIIGYVGQANASLSSDLKTFLIFLKYNFDVFRGKIFSDYYKLCFFSKKRFKYLKKLQMLKKCKTNFVFRKKYRAGVKSESERITTTTEFYENIKNSHYTFCIRGGGNFSLRLYETLAMGRIPLLINTDCSLPFQTVIDWSKHCVIVDESNFTNTEDELLRFHSKFDEKQFLELQTSNRLLWQNYFTRVGYFSKIHDLFCEGKI